MSSSSGDREPVELLAEEFLERRRRGEKPTIQEYAEKHPQLADEIRDVFPTLLLDGKRRSWHGRNESVLGRHGGRSSGLPSRTAWATTASCAKSAVARWESSTRRSSSPSDAAWR